VWNHGVRYRGKRSSPCHPLISVEPIALLVKACLRRWSPSSLCCRKEEKKHRAAWSDLWLRIQCFLEAYAGAMLRRHQIADRLLADEIAVTVFESLATAPQRHVRRSKKEAVPSGHGERQSSILMSRLRQYRNRQRRRGEAVAWDSLAKYLQQLVRNEVRKVVRKGRHQWCSGVAIKPLQSPEPPVTEAQFLEAVNLIRARLATGTLLDTFLTEVVRDALSDLPGTDGARRVRLTRLKRRAQELLEAAGLL
jgi:hypothetical protein